MQIKNIIMFDGRNRFALSCANIIIAATSLLPEHILFYSSLHPLHYFFCRFRDTIDSVKQSAALTLLKLIRSSPDVIQMGEWASRVVHLLNDQHMGVVTAAVSLIETLVKKHPDEYKGCVQLAVSRLSRVMLHITPQVDC